MAEQARLGLEAGIPDAVFQTNGNLVRLAPGKPAIIGQELTGRLILDGDVILPADGGTMNERRKISTHGQISVAVALDADGDLIAQPAIRMQGVPVEEERDAFLIEAADAAGDVVREGFADIEKLREKIRLAVRRTATRWTGKKPVVDVLLIAQ
jgi:ribonuclease J